MVVRLIRRLLDFLLRRSKTDSSGLPSSPLISRHHGDRRTLRINLYQTDDLTRANGRIPERVAARFLDKALTRCGYNLTIRFGYDAVPENGYRNADEMVLSLWASQRFDDPRAKHLLIHGGNGGGIAYVGGRYGIAPGGNIDRPMEIVDVGETALHRNVRACLHEVGHLLGGRHSDRMQAAPTMWYQNVDTGWMDSPPADADLE